MNADQIKRQRRHLQRSYSSSDTTARLAQLLVHQRNAPTRSKSFDIELCRTRVIQTRPDLERSISGLGMEDPVIAVPRGCRDRLESAREEVDDDDNASVSIASDPTANAENEGLNIALFHASLSMGDNSGMMSLSHDSCWSTTSHSGHLDSDDTESIGMNATHYPSTKEYAVASSPPLVKPNLIFPPGVVDLQASIQSINLNEALEICRQLDAEEIEQFNQHQQQSYRLRRQTSNGSRSNVIHCRSSVNSDSSPGNNVCASSSPHLPNMACHDAGHDECLKQQSSYTNQTELARSVSLNSDAIQKSPSSAPWSNGFTPRRSKRTVRKLHVVSHAANSMVSLEDMATFRMGRTSPL